jgi:rubrerythrin
LPGKEKPTAPQPELNIFPGNWTVKTQQMLKAFELSFAQNWNPVTFHWEELDGKNFDPKPRVAQAYWMTKLALFEKSGIGAFGFGAVRAAELNLEDPTKKMLASITYDECRHDEVCRRACDKLCPNFPYAYHPQTDFEKSALRNIETLYDEGKRYWNGFVKAWDQLSPEMIFAGFFFAEIGAETIFNSMRQTSRLEIYRQAFQNITRDETRHLVATMSLLRAMSEQFDEEQKLRITRQMKQGFIFLSPLLYKHRPDFWKLPADFDKVDQEMEEIARDAGLGALTLEEKVKFWREAIEKKRAEIEEMGIKIPAIPEIGIEGVEVQVKKNETIATTF